MENTPSYYVSRKTLLLTAAIIWLIAGVNVFAVGIQTWIITEMSWLLKSMFALITFLIFNFIIFGPLSKKYSKRILSYTDQSHPLSFFDIKGWLIMIFMMGLGFSVRKFDLLPNTFIAPFYVGLSIALSLTGIQFLIYWVKLNKI
ncbi:hypothetical protein [Bacteroides coprosuis]|uniref:hypothetical protein n=1 Tax=Bacteroides coprosuis TaxID=151276 RepID=UPI001D301D30|nr:hypothetical protein [Bacteroides coprosuis]HJD92261.1 hypothetical protein [Bacteroides coprosuis]